MAVILASLLPGLAFAEGDCAMEDCQEFKEWNVGRTLFASGRVVYMAETPAYYSDQAEHSLAFVFTPGKCEVPLPYFRYPAHAGRATYQAAFSGRFRVNAADYYDFRGRLFFPEGRVGTGLFDSIQPSLFHFVEAVKGGETLNSISAYSSIGSSNNGRAVLHEYRLDGSRDALQEAQRRCLNAPPETLQANAAVSGNTSPPAFKEPASVPQPIDASRIPAPVAPISRQCSDLGFLDNPLVAAEFNRLNGRLRNVLGIDLDGLGIPYEVVCQDLLDGFSADGIAEALIEKYSPQHAYTAKPSPAPSQFEPRWYDEQPPNYQPYYQQP